MTEAPDTPTALYGVRRALIAARREADDCQRWLAQREAELTLMGAADGKNETERKARLVLALSTDERARELREGLRAAAEHVAHLEVEEQYHRDLRRAREWTAREQLGLVAEE